MDFIFFWKTNEKYGFMSQWYIAPMYVGGVIYISCEQYMMSAKALMFGDTAIYDEIMQETNQSKIKSLGRKVKNFDNAIWNQHKDRIVYEANYAKFTQNQDLYEKLFQTGDAILAEASPYDKIYGIGMKADNPDVRDMSIWGYNLLGQAIMKVRQQLQHVQD